MSNGRFALGLGSGYRKYEFEGFGVDFEARRDIQEELLPLLLLLLLPVMSLASTGSGPLPWIGCSEAIRMAVSAATMPPMEWPIRITRTEESMVGDGVSAATSISITLLRSLE